MKIPSVWSEPLTDYLNSRLQDEAARKFRIHQLPADLKTWKTHRASLEATLWKKLGVSIDHKLDLDYHETNTIKMDGYVVKSIYYQSRPGIYVTGNLYVPNGGKKPFPAVINVHGHWQQGRLAERVQARGHLLAKNGYVCLCVDAFGSGERSTEHGKFEYHGGNIGASLMNIGESLMGAQVVDNMRGVDLLCSLDFVDSKKIGATGASGGGNQTMWLAALDERITAAMPVVSVGSFESYVARHNCVCELLVDGLTFTEESGVLALTAPRALKICNCLHDTNPTFFVTEMLRSFKEAQKIYKAMESYDKFSYQAFNRPHGYWPEIREAMLGWFDLHLKGIGNGMPKLEVPFETLSEENVMVFKKGERPDFVTGIPEYCRKKGNELRKKFLSSKSFNLDEKAEELKSVLRISDWLELENVHEYSQEGVWKKFALETVNGDMIPVIVVEPSGKASEYVIFLHPLGKNEIPEDAVNTVLKEKKAAVLVDIWGTGETYTDPVGGYRTLARSSLWLGKSMQGEWVKNIELISWFISEYFKTAKVSIHAYKETAVAALMLNALKNTNKEIILEEAPVSFLFNKTVPPDFYSMAFFLPDALKWGDLSLAAAMSNANITFLTPMLSDGEKLSAEEIQSWKKEFDAVASKCKSKTKVTLK